MIPFLLVFFLSCFVSANLLSDLDRNKQFAVKSEQFPFCLDQIKKTCCCETTISVCFFRTCEFKNLFLLVGHVVKLHLVSRHSWMVGQKKKRTNYFVFVQLVLSDTSTNSTEAPLQHQKPQINICQNWEVTGSR